MYIEKVIECFCFVIMWKKKNWYRYDMYSVFFIFCYVIEYFIFSMFNVENLRDMLNFVE